MDLYPHSIHQEDLSPDDIGLEIHSICEEIYEACKGWGTNEARLLKAMGSQTPETRCKVYRQYKKMYGKNLKDVMKSECGSRDFGTALQYLAVSPVDAECVMLHRACKGLGTDEVLLYTILGGRTNKEMEILKKNFFDMYTKDLGQLLASELSGNLESFMLNLLQATEEPYDKDYHTEDKMQDDIASLYNMGQGRMGTNEVGIFKFLCKLPPEYLRTMSMKYAEEHGYTIPKVVEKEFGGQIRDAAVFMVNMKLKPIEAIAGLIDKACKGWGTNELLLTTTLIRYQSVLKKVDIAHKELYEESIEKRVISETSGDYRKLLTEVIQTGMNL